MRVLISASTFPLREGDGIPRFVFDLARALGRHFDVLALAPDAPGAALEEEMDGVVVRRFTYFLPRSRQALAYGYGIRENLRRSFWARLQPLSLIVCAALATRRLAAAREVGVVNSHWLVPQGLATALARGRSPGRFRHVLTVHAGDVYLLAKLPFGGALARFVVDRCDFVYAVGSHVRDHLDALLGRPSGATLEPMGASVDAFRDGPVDAEALRRFPGGYLVFVGRFTEKKGAVYLLQALPRVRERHPELGLVLIGYGALEPELRAEAKRLDLDDAVWFAGRRDHAEIGGFLRGARLAVVPSVIDRHGETEGMPTVVVEAMSAGARVVGSAVDGIPDLIRDGENGWLCREKDPDDLSAKLLLALDDEGASGVAERGRETAADHDWDAIADRYAAVFRQLADREDLTGAEAEGGCEGRPGAAGEGARPGR